jgi:hypothetical protein
MDVQSLRGAIYSPCSILLPKKEEEKRICLQLSSTAVFKRSSNGEFVDLLFGTFEGGICGANGYATAATCLGAVRLRRAHCPVF